MANTKKDWRRVTHKPHWEPAELPYNAAGDTKPGFVCTHQLENGNGLCGGNVFELSDEFGGHTCMVRLNQRRKRKVGVNAGQFYVN